jgi:hypothetical protein
VVVDVLPSLGRRLVHMPSWWIRKIGSLAIDRAPLTECLAKQYGEDGVHYNTLGGRNVEMAVVVVVFGRKPSTLSNAGRYAHGMLHVSKSHTP